MDQWKPPNDLSPPLNSNSAAPTTHPHASNPQQQHRIEMGAKDAIAARKVQKADREKLRRDRLNEHFLELGNALDPDRPKNDKATILTDTIQMLKDLTDEVNRLKAECAALSEESRELTQEKNELKEEKACLKSDIDNLNVQYQQRLRVMYPWSAIDPSVVMAPPYSFPVALPLPPATIPMHPSFQPFPVFGNQSPAAISNPRSTFIPYPTPANPNIDQSSGLYASASHISSKQDSRSKTSGRQRVSGDEKSDDSGDVVTELELKVPGSSTQRELSPGDKKGKQQARMGRYITDGSCSSWCSSSQGFQDSSNSDSDGRFNK